MLTLGIAVDANVLINERVREELAAGKSAKTAVDQGYDRAFWTIFDAHVTTFIAGAHVYSIDPRRRSFVIHSRWWSRRFASTLGA